MLDEVRAKNLGLIADAVLTPGAGLTVITGETGTGKTLILGALRLVRGDTASKGTLGPHGDTTDVAARILERDDETVARRVVTKRRSRAYLNGTPATAKELASSVGPLISIVAQHDQHTLASSEGIRKIIDGMFTPDDQPVLNAYNDAYSDLRAVESEMDALGSDRRGLERELEMARFQVAEITDAGFLDGDEETLRARLDRLRHAEEITTELSVATVALGDSGVGDHVGRALGAVDRIARYDDEASTLSSRLLDVAETVNELLAELSRYASAIEGDPVRLDADERRSAELSALKRKYGDTIADVNAFAKKADERSDTIERLLDAAQTLGDRHANALNTLTETSKELRAVRVDHARHAQGLAQLHLKDLGFSDPLVRVLVEAKAPAASGADRFRILFASDSALTPAPITSIASGGELSRLVLALTLASGGADAEVVAFDEIDAGIGGSTALAMGEKLAELSRSRQVICVTHLPQVAAYASCHYTVVRSGTTAQVEEIAGDRRVEEISRMLAGMADSEKGKKHAKELLDVASGSVAVKGET